MGDMFYILCVGDNYYNLCTFGTHYCLAAGDLSLCLKSAKDLTVKYHCIDNISEALRELSDGGKVCPTVLETRRQALKDHENLFEEEIEQAVREGLKEVQEKYRSRPNRVMKRTVVGVKNPVRHHVVKLPILHHDITPVESSSPAPVKRPLMLRRPVLV